MPVRQKYIMDVTNKLSRPSIRIEIKNDIVESMEVDDDNEVEDGQLSDQDNDTTEQNENQEGGEKSTQKLLGRSLQNKWLNKDGGFTTGVNIFAKEEQEKLGERAKRFGLKPDETKAMTDQQLQELHESLGVTVADEKNIRFEAIHMRGVEEMSTQDVFVYFNAYGPSSIEWINDFSCNVVWLDKISAARALHGLSKPIRGMEFIDETNPFAETAEIETNDETTEAELMVKKSSGRSILLIDTESKKNEEPLPAIRKERSVLLISSDSQSQQSEESTAEDVVVKEKTHRISVHNEDNNDYVNATDIRIPIPPGYWRYGKPYPKARSILLRFALKTDRKPLHAEKLSEYYKKYGNPNFGGMKGLITTSRKRKLRRIFNVTDPEPEVIQPENETKNPWGSLAKNWNVEDRTMIRREPDYKPPPTRILNDEPEESNPVVSTAGKSIRQRVGTVIPEAKNPSEEESQSDEETEWTKKIKVPRMRMYADDEEEKIKVRAEKQKKISALNRIWSKEASQTTASTPTQVDLRARLMKTTRRRNMNKQDSDTENRSVYSDHYRNQTDDYKVSRSVLLRQNPHTNVADEESSQRKQRSTVSVVNKELHKPKVASTVWSRVSDNRHSSILRSAVQKRPSSPIPVRTKIKKEKTSDSESDSADETESESESTSDDSSSNDGNYKRGAQPTSLSERPQFIKGDLRSRLGFKPQDTLRIEVDNDWYKKT